MSEYIFVTNIFEYSNIRIYSSHSVSQPLCLLLEQSFTCLASLAPPQLLAPHTCTPVSSFQRGRWRGSATLCTSCSCPAGSETHVWAWVPCVAGLGPSCLPMWPGDQVVGMQCPNQTFLQLGAAHWTSMASNGSVRRPGHSLWSSHTSPSWNPGPAFARSDARILIWFNKI